MFSVPTKFYMGLLEWRGCGCSPLAFFTSTPSYRWVSTQSSRLGVAAAAAAIRAVRMSLLGVHTHS